MCINTTEIFTGVSNNSRVNVGLIFQVRSNTLGGQGALDVFSFEDNGNDRRSGLTTIAPSIRVQPFKSIANFSFTSSFYIPLFLFQIIVHWHGFDRKVLAVLQQSPDMNCAM